MAAVARRNLVGLTDTWDRIWRIRLGRSPHHGNGFERYCDYLLVYAYLVPHTSILGAAGIPSPFP